MKFSLHEVKVCSPPSMPGTSKNVKTGESVPYIWISFLETFIVTGSIESPVTKSFPCGLPEIKVFRIEDFPLPASPMTTTDCLKGN